MALIIPDLFGAYMEGKRTAIADNWNDISRYNTEQRNQIANMRDLATFDADVNKKYEDLTKLALENMFTQDTYNYNVRAAELADLIRQAQYPGIYTKAKTDSDYLSANAKALSELENMARMAELNRIITGNIATASGATPTSYASPGWPGQVIPASTGGGFSTTPSGVPAIPNPAPAQASQTASPASNSTTPSTGSDATADALAQAQWAAKLTELYGIDPANFSAGFQLPQDVLTTTVQGPTMDEQGRIRMAPRSYSLPANVYNREWAPDWGNLPLYSWGAKQSAMQMPDVDVTPVPVEELTAQGFDMTQAGALQPGRYMTGASGQNILFMDANGKAWLSPIEEVYTERGQSRSPWMLRRYPVNIPRAQ